MNKYKKVIEYLELDSKENNATSLEWSISNYKSTVDPNVWGPAFWFTLHNSSIHYPKKASPITKERCKGFIIGIPYMIPCQECSEHAILFIEKYRHILDQICESRENLFKFFNDFHNDVNKRLNKKEVSLEEAYKIYKNNTLVTLKY